MRAATVTLDLAIPEGEAVVAEALRNISKRYRRDRRLARRRRGLAKLIDRSATLPSVVAAFQSRPVPWVGFERGLVLDGERLRGATSTRHDGETMIVLDPKAATPLTVLHEVAHAIAGVGEGHGGEWASVFVALIDETYGNEWRG